MSGWFGYLYGHGRGLRDCPAHSQLERYREEEANRWVAKALEEPTDREMVCEAIIDDVRDLLRDEAILDSQTRYER